MDKSCNIIWNSFQHFDRIVRQFIITLLISAAFNEGLERDLIKNQQSREIIFFFIRASAYNRKNYRLFRGLLSALGANIRAYFCEFCLNMLLMVPDGGGEGPPGDRRGKDSKPKSRHCRGWWGRGGGMYGGGLWDSLSRVLGPPKSHFYDWL